MKMDKEIVYCFDLDNSALAMQIRREMKSGNSRVVQKAFDSMMFVVEIPDTCQIYPGHTKLSYVSRGTDGPYTISFLVDCVEYFLNWSDTRYHLSLDSLGFIPTDIVIQFLLEMAKLHPFPASKQS